MDYLQYVGMFAIVVAVSFVLVSVVSYIIDQVKEHNQKRRKIKTEQIEAVACYLIHEYGLNKDQVYILRDRVAVKGKDVHTPSQWGGITIERINT